MKTGLARFFGDRLYSAMDVPNGKPAPDLFLHAAATMGVEPKRCAVVEDSAPGVVAALAAGMRAFAYAGGVTPVERLRAAGGSAVIFHHMAELPALLRA
jgi:beta-phosphoglucomutase-like phosphatase (HAD superfamily)